VKRSVAVLASAVLTLAAPELRASDHLDGPATSKDRVTDLTDLYAFPTPGVAGSLTIALDVYPVVAATGHFYKPAYLEIEHILTAHTPHQTCGGRKPSDDMLAPAGRTGPHATGASTGPVHRR
jgi:hypothetical protein